jgi:hypothetical protein
MSRSRKDSAVHVSLSCLQPVKQQTDRRAFDPEAGAHTQLLRKEKMPIDDANQRREVGGLMLLSPLAVNTQCSFSREFFDGASQAANPPRSPTDGTPSGV